MSCLKYLRSTTLNCEDIAGVENFVCLWKRRIFFVVGRPVRLRTYPLLLGTLYDCVHFLCCWAPCTIAYISFVVEHPARLRTFPLLLGTLYDCVHFLCCWAPCTLAYISWAGQEPTTDNFITPSNLYYRALSRRMEKDKQN